MKFMSHCIPGIWKSKGEVFGLDRILLSMYNKTNVREAFEQNVDLIVIKERSAE